MDTKHAEDHDDLHSNFRDLSITKPAAHIAVVEPQENPWDDHTNADDTDDEPSRHTLLTPDPSLLDASATQGFAADPDPPPPTTHPVTAQDVLLEFDPLAHSEENAAREAWASAPAHPPPPAPIPDLPTKEPPDPPPKDTLAPQRPSSPALPAFPGLAALARSFSIPITLGGRARPRSLDTAAAVPSPATLSFFASQQAAPPMRADTDGDRGSGGSTSAGAGGSASGSGRNTPSGQGGSRKDPLAFDFQKFLDQMKTKSAEPVAKYLRSFLSNFAKRTFTVGDQVKLINDFLNFISERMRECDVWRNASDAEFDNAMEGMEKLVMNRLYDFTFTPQVARSIPPRPVTADDLERDRVLSQRIALFTWIEPKHLDVPEGDGSEGFLMFAQQELLKINHYKAPRDKLICILNCCKVIFGLIRHLHKEEGADTFVPILIYTVLKANPQHLLSNVEFINRFRNPQKLQSEAGYYLSSLMGAVSFIETMDHTSLSNITQEEFERNVEEAIQSLPSPSTRSTSPATSTVSLNPSPSTPTFLNPNASPSSSHTGEESAQPLSLPTPAQTLGEDARRFLQKTGDTISKPLSAISRIFSEVLDGAAEDSMTYLPGPFAPFELGREQQEQGAQPQLIQTPYKPRVRRTPSSSPSARSLQDETPARAYGSSPNLVLALEPPAHAQVPRVQALAASASSPHISRTPTPNLDIAGLQAEIDRAHEKAGVAARETLRQIFPGMDEEVMGWVLEANEGNLGKSIEALLEMSGGS